MRFFSAFLLFSLSAAVQSFEHNLVSLEDDFSEEAFSESDDVGHFSSELPLPRGKSLRRGLQEIPDVCFGCECVTETDLVNVNTRTALFNEQRELTQRSLQFNIERFQKLWSDVNMANQVCIDAGVGPDAGTAANDQCVGSFVKSLGFGGRKEKDGGEPSCRARRELASEEEPAELAGVELASSAELAPSLVSSSHRHLQNNRAVCRERRREIREKNAALKADRDAWDELRDMRRAVLNGLKCRVLTIRFRHRDCNLDNRNKLAREECLGRVIREQGLLDPN